mgnify:CR=1 FL=1
MSPIYQSNKLMKTFKCYLIGIFLVPFLLSAQQGEIALKQRTFYPGYIVDLNKDTIRGYLFFSTLIGNQTHIKFYRDLSGKELIAKYNPGDIVGYGIMMKAP